MINNTWERENFWISTDKTKLQIETIHTFLVDTHWAKDISLDRLQLSIEHSLCFGVYHQEKQIGFARVITDLATFAYLTDVFILPNYRHRGLAKWLMGIIFNLPELNLRQWILITKDAHSLYKFFGFSPVSDSTRIMQKLKPLPK